MMDPRYMSARELADELARQRRWADDRDAPFDVRGHARAMVRMLEDERERRDPRHLRDGTRGTR
jgi:hypothetical protein